MTEPKNGRQSSTSICGLNDFQRILETEIERQLNQPP